MDIKDLNKPQLLLLAVLLSFITSLATGITTVTLMQQAPDSVIMPVNRIIKQTVEKIQQVEGKTVTQTVVVKEEDLVVDAIAKNKSAVFTITKMGIDASGINAEVPAGVGFALNADGVIVADAVLAPGQNTYFVKNDSGKFKADFISADASGFSFLKVGAAVDGTSKLAVTAPAFGDLDKMKVGQKVIVMGASISSFIFDGKNINISVNSSNAGGLVLNLDGEALGIALSGASTSFAPINTINDALKALNLPAATPPPQ
jgi:S1-C subfamily serine protease